MLRCIVSGWFAQLTMPLTNGCAALPQKREESGSVYVCDQHAGRVWAKLASHHSVSSRHTLMSPGSLVSPPQTRPYITTQSVAYVSILYVLYLCGTNSCHPCI